MRKISRRPWRFLVAVYIVIIFVVAFASGKSLLVLSSPPLSGDWIVTGTESYYDEVIVLNGNLFVMPTGNLTFRKVTLKINCTYNGQYNITVKPGGKLYVLENSIITSANPDKKIGFFRVEPDSTFRMTNSELHDCGRELILSGLMIHSGDAIVENSLFSRNNVGIISFGDVVIVRNNITANNAGIEVAAGAHPIICDNYLSLNNWGMATFGSPTIYNNTIVRNGRGIEVEGGSPNIYNNTITSNSGYGITIHGNESAPTIEDNIIALNKHIGIFCNHNCSPIIQGNNISLNGQGIELLGHSTGKIEGNLIASNGIPHAIIFENAANLTIHDNVIIKNGAGIFSWNSSSVISSNLIAENLREGITCAYFCSSTILNNTVTSNLENGIHCIDHSDATIQGNNITSNNGTAIVLKYNSAGIIEGNIITDNGWDGIFLEDYSSPLIQGNIITSNRATGIICQNNSLPEIHWNDIYDNAQEFGGHGIANDDSSVTVNATHNYWGDGPSISGDVLATPWLTESIFHAEITSPLSGEMVSSTVTVSTEAHAYSEVHKVEFYIDGELEYTDYDVSFDWNWDTTQYMETEHRITTKAYDMLGLKTSTSITIFVDNTAPTVSIKEPTTENTYSGTVRISVNATDNRELANVHVKVENTEWLVMTYNSTDLLWKYDLNTTTFSDGQHTLMILALDEASNPTTTSTTLFIDNTPPTLTIQTPQSGATVGMTLSVEIQASDASGISRIEFYLQDVLVHTDHDTPYDWLWDTTQYPNGAYTITVNAYDLIGHRTSSETTVTVKNVESPWWQTHLWTMIEVLIAIGGLILGILTFFASKKKKRK